MDITHTIDPDGDVLYTFKDPNTLFAVWDDATMTYGRPEPGDVQNEHTGAVDAQPGAIDVGVRSPPTVQDSGSQNEVEKPEVRMLVSSRHLVLASPYFKEKFTGPWKEASAGATTNAPFILKARDCAEEAMLVVMNILHGKTRQVPRNLPPGLLAEIAAIVQRYRCHQAVEVFSDLWLAACKSNGQPPTGYGREAVLRLFVSWVFSDEEEFQSMTQFLQKRSRGPLHTLNLHIPQAIADRMEDKRQASVRHILNQIYSTLTDLSQEEAACSKNCSAMRLGALLRHMIEQGLYPRPEAPYLGISFSHLAWLVDSFAEPLWYEYCPSGLRLFDARGKSFEDGWNSCVASMPRKGKRVASLRVASEAYQAQVWSDPKLQPHACSVMDSIIPTVLEAEGYLAGFSLSDFRAERD